MVKIKTYNDCVGCAECIGCGRNRDYQAECIECDVCGEDELETAYVYEGQEYCKRCILEKLSVGYGKCERCDTECDTVYMLDGILLCDDCLFDKLETIGE